MLTTVKRHNLKMILSGREQQAAGRMLFNVLLLRRRLAGTNMTYLAKKLGVDPSALTANYNEVSKRLDKEHGGYGFNPLPFSRLLRDQSLYMPTLDTLEIDACVTLANKRAEMLIRSTFMEDTSDVVVFRAKEKVKRKPGRPKGSTKDRDQAPEGGWLMPDGTRFG